MLGDSVVCLNGEIGGEMAETPKKSLFAELKAAVGVCSMRALKRSPNGAPFALIVNDRVSSGDPSGFVRQETGLEENE